MINEQYEKHYLRDVLDAPDDRFKEFVNADIRNYVGYDADEAAEIKAALRSKDGVARWGEALREIRRNLRSQLEANRVARLERQMEIGWLPEPDRSKEWAEYTAKQDRWRTNVLRVMGGTETKLEEQARQSQRYGIDVYRLAIIEHRDAMAELDDDDDPDEIDNALWDVL